MLPSDPSEDRSRPPDSPGERTRASTAYQACAVIIGLAPAALILIFGHGLPLRNLAIPALISALFALFAWLLRGVTASGAIAGFGVAYALYVGFGWWMFAVLLFVFVLTWAATRAGKSRKVSRGLAEPAGGRTAAQVVANVGLAAWLLAAFPLARLFHYLPARPLLDIAALAVLAEAAADTCASEIGKAFAGTTFLISTGKKVPPGTDGGVSGWGVLAAIAAAAATALVTAWLLPIGLTLVVLLTVAPTLATFVDSLLGATLERRGWINNDGVNLLSTGVAAVLAAALCLF